MFLESCEKEKVCFSLPCVLADEKENPLEVLKKIVAEELGIDCQVGMVALAGKHNVGSRRRKQFVNALAFTATAKNYFTKRKVKWVAMKEAKAMRLCRQSEWLAKVK